VTVREQLALCVGAAKAGTTTLHALMARHPAVCVTRHKETNFFYDDRLFARGYDAYLNDCFVRNAGCRLKFEADPRYMLHGRCIDRIATGFPDARIIVMLRHPVERAYSHYVYRMTYGRHAQTFEEMCAEEERLIAGGDEALGEYGFLARSRYAAQIEHIYRRFPREQVYFLLFERLLRDQPGEFRRLQQWLGLPPADVGPVWENETGEPRSPLLARLLYHPRYRGVRKLARVAIPAQPLRNAVTGALARLNLRRPRPSQKPALDPQTRTRLMRELADDVARTEKLTGLDLSLWR